MIKDTKLENIIKTGDFETSLKEYWHCQGCLTPEQITKSAIKNPEKLDLTSWKKLEGKEVLMENIILTHATDHFPVTQKNHLFIYPSGIAEPIYSTFYYHQGREDLKKYIGVSNYRLTVHFGTLGAPPSHMTTNETGKNVFGTLSNKNFIIVANAKQLIDNSQNNLASSLNQTDTFFFNQVILPHKSIIIVKKKALNKILIKPEILTNYQIIVLNNNQNFEDISKIQDYAINKNLDNLTIKSDKYNQITATHWASEHFNSIFNEIEYLNQLSSVILDKRPKHIPTDVSDPISYQLLEKISDLTITIGLPRLINILNIMTNQDKINQYITNDDYQSKIKNDILSILIPKIKADLNKIVPLFDNFKDKIIKDIYPSKYTIFNLKQDKGYEYKESFKKSIVYLHQILTDFINNSPLSPHFQELKIIQENITCFLTKNYPNLDINK